MADITDRPALLTTFTFGKYRGKAVAEIAENDPGYLRWLFNNLDRMSPELRLTLRHYLGNSAYTAAFPGSVPCAGAMKRRTPAPPLHSF